MITQGFVANGAKVYISSRDSKACSQAAEELNALGKGEVIALPADLQKLEECERLVKEISSREPKLHVLVNNSGTSWGESLETYPDAAWAKLLTLNLQRVFTLTQLLMPLLEGAGSASDPARIINIGSIDGLRVPIMSTFAYSASKAGLHHLSRHLATQLGPRHVTSNTLACGAFDTKMMAPMLRSFREEIVGANPLGRIGTPEDVAGACIFLASRAGYVHTKQTPARFLSVPRSRLALICGSAVQC
jgi:NAD(P)-dependent dehydrogenase (short-subunit alcohol dehydrogenase family)